MAPPSLLGPPEIHLPTATTTATTAPPPLGFTENLSATYLSSGHPCLDFFFHVVPDTPADQVVNRVQTAWNHDPLTTLKLICNLRGVRGTGKSDKEGFYTAALWLHDHHPKTLALNMRAISEFGYFKDSLEILYRLLEGSDIRKTQNKIWQTKKYEYEFKKSNQQPLGRGGYPVGLAPPVGYPLGGGYPVGVGPVGFTNYTVPAPDPEQLEPKKKSAESKAAKLNKMVAAAKKGFERYNRDPHFRFLHDQVSSLFAELLKNDMELLNEGKLKKISLASKWCPSLDSSYDRAILMCESIARKLFPRGEFVEYEGMEEAHYAFKVRDRLRKEVLVPLHQALQLPEVFICANKWDQLPYNRVASVAMKHYKKLFYKHDIERFQQYLEKVKKGEATIAAGALLPHEIIASLRDPNGAQVAELQWKRMVDDLAKKGKLKNCMAICDVSGSMEGIPMEVSVALGLLISELSEDPWKGQLITFSANPMFHKIKGDTLSSKTEFIRRMDWGANTDFQKVFDRILDVAVKGKLKEEDMIQRLFVFSDMEFDQASAHRYRSHQNYYHPSVVGYNPYVAGYNPYGIPSTMGYQTPQQMNQPFMGYQTTQQTNQPNSWDTDYEVIQRKFREKGYQKVPEIVFWNLRNSKATPVPSDKKGVALVSGFSKNLVTIFLEEGGILSPEAVMLKAIAGEEYQKLQVFD